MAIPFYKWLLVLCLAVSILLFNKNRATYLKWLVPFFCLEVVAEFASPLGLFKNQSSNHWFFNLVSIIEFEFYFFLFIHALKSEFGKKFTRLLIIIFPVLCCLNFMFIQSFFTFHTITYRVGAILIVFLCFKYFEQLLKSTGLINLVSLPMFWIATGLLFFYTGFFIYMSAFDYIVYKKVSYSEMLWTIISDTLNAILYLSFLLSLLCHLQKKKYYT